MSWRLLGELLHADGLPAAVIEAGLATARAEGMRLGEALLARESITPEQLARALAAQQGLPWLAELPADISPALLEGLTLPYLRELRALPLSDDGDSLLLAVADPLDFRAAQDLSLLRDRPVRLAVVTPELLLAALHRTFEHLSGGSDGLMAGIDAGEGGLGAGLGPADLLDSGDEAPVIRFVNSLLTQACRQRASDIHLEPFERELVVRYRIDGVLHEVLRPPRSAHAGMVSRIKIMADLDIAEKRLPQDGRFRVRVAGKDVDVRVSTLPTAFGERVVLRLLDKSAGVLSLREVGLDEALLPQVKALTDRSHGIFLVTGPTGSGKTTTLYAALSRLNTRDKNIITVEDPIEYQLAGVGQIQVNPKIDLTFANGLRSILRQDPDIIMVGEIRDAETAGMAVQAALTGHLVFSTLHTNDSAGALTRLVEMGVEPFLAASAIQGILAQRLVRVLCPACREEAPADAAVLAGLGGAVAPADRFFRGRGCEACLGLGYKGRTGIFELLVPDDDIRELVLRKADATSIKNLAVRKGMVSLMASGLARARAGITSLEEVLRVTQEEA